LQNGLKPFSINNPCRRAKQRKQIDNIVTLERGLKMKKLFKRIALNICLTASMALFLFSIILALAANGNVPSQKLINDLAEKNIFTIK